MWKDAFNSSLETMNFGKIFMRQGILLGHFLCDRVQGVERFAAHPRHFPSQVPPPDFCVLVRLRMRKASNHISGFRGKFLLRIDEDVAVEGAFSSVLTRCFTHMQWVNSRQNEPPDLVFMDLMQT